MRKRTGTIEDRGTSWRIRYYDPNGIRQRETYATKDEAEQQLAIRLGEIAKGLPVSSKPNTVLFEELAADVITDYKVNKFASLDDIDARLRLHILPVLGKRKAGQITTAQLKHYVVLRQAEISAHTKKAPAIGTINRELEAIRHTFKLAIEGRKLLHMPHVPHLRENNVRAGFFTREEVERLCRHLKKPFDSFVWFGFLTGWRVSEIRGLLWRNVDFERGEIRIDVGHDKNREGRVRPMNMELRTLLTRLKPKTLRTNNTAVAGRMPAPVVATYTHFVFVGVGEFRKSWLTACHKAGLPCIYDKATKKPIKALRTFHDLRRSFAREMSRLGVREAAIMKLGGWLTRSVFDRYNVVSEEDLRDAVAKMDEGKSPANRPRSPYGRGKRQ